MGIDTADCGIGTKVDLSPQRIIPLDQVHNATSSRRVVKFIVSLVHQFAGGVGEKKLFFGDVKPGVMLIIEVNDSVRL